MIWLFLFINVLETVLRAGARVSLAPLVVRPQLMKAEINIISMSISSAGRFPACHQVAAAAMFLCGSKVASFDPACTRVSKKRMCVDAFIGVGCGRPEFRSIE